ncbi:hypothetical protein [Fischerella thermalis]|uniref:hypothetical protein n=1 Tax=Fischerella thermalis TaxID=372787 RepID=UPI001CA53462|nr:hypothetical protein [Fischerella thermalis]
MKIISEILKNPYTPVALCIIGLFLVILPRLVKSEDICAKGSSRSECTQMISR